MADFESQVDFTRMLQTVEHDRIELVQQAVEVLRGIQSGNQSELTEALASVIGLAYLLGSQMGIGPHAIDQQALGNLRVMGDLDAARRTDTTPIIRHLGDRL